MMLDAPATLATLLAQTKSDPGALVERAKLQDISKTVNDGIQHDLPWELLLVGLGTTLIAIVVISMRRWWLARQDDPSPLVLYSAIARKAGLNWPDRFFLWRIARAADLPTPIALLLARGTFRHHAQQYMTDRSVAARQRLNERLKRIESALFG